MEDLVNWPQFSQFPCTKETSGAENYVPPLNSSKTQLLAPRAALLAEKSRERALFEYVQRCENVSGGETEHNKYI